ncbi:hypothetical protein CMV_022323 [Castanea mollissima]|uniref:non-specific serine/threonine protein kinase n=1 Tax=Castanea mollissima TaxID=60419 RepID=A0A8J4VEF7_9ROSI|nr:hypothetical protein CMV_022323 [Castanea mollissima]
MCWPRVSDGVSGIIFDYSLPSLSNLLLKSNVQNFLRVSRSIELGQVNLVDWLKMMVGSRRSEEVVDPNIEARPSTRALKRALLTALRCVDLR